MHRCITLGLAACLLSPIALAQKQITHSVKQSPKTININQASAKELVNLSGLGPKRAQAIVTYRQKHGRFKSLADLVHVPGVGKAHLKSWMNAPVDVPHLVVGSS